MQEGKTYRPDWIYPENIPPPIEANQYSAERRVISDDRYQLPIYSQNVNIIYLIRGEGREGNTMQKAPGIAPDSNNPAKNLALYQNDSIFIPVRTYRSTYNVLMFCALYINRTKNDQINVLTGSRNRGLTTVSAIVIKGAPIMIPILKQVVSQLSSFPSVVEYVC